MAKRRYDPSPDRQLLDHLARELSQIVRAFCEHGPVVRGRFVTLRRRCGYSGCRCSRGELHETPVLLERTSGKGRVHKDTRELRRDLRKPLEDNRRLRRLRMRLRKLHRELLAACDRLREDRLREGTLLIQRLTV
jgi:hypothetical protein